MLSRNAIVLRRSQSAWSMPSSGRLFIRTGNDEQIEELFGAQFDCSFSYAIGLSGVCFLQQHRG
jgi:hypothetical protein